MNVIPIRMFLLFTLFFSFPGLILASEKDLERYFIAVDLRESFDRLFKNNEFHDAFMRKDKKKLASLGCTIYPAHWGNVVVEHPDMPGYLIKGEKPYQNKNWRRVLYGEEIKNAIQPYQSMIVPDEYLYHYPDRPTIVHSDNYCVISKKLPLKDITITRFLMTRPQLLQDIQSVMIQVKFWDPGIRDNIRVTVDEKVAFLDTEPHSDDCNPVLQFILDRIFFQGLPRGQAVANKLSLMVENEKNPESKTFKTAKLVGKYALYAATIYAGYRVVSHYWKK